MSRREITETASRTAMKELLRSNDPVLISWLQARLAEEGIESLVFDTHVSILEGSISAIPRRLMVIDDDHPRAKRIVAAAEAETVTPRDEE